MAPENRDEVRQRIDSLYDRAETDSGTYNATRAMSLATRSRGVPLAKRGRRRTDPALDAMAQQWFDAARAQLGPSVPAVLPKDRQPALPPASERFRDRSDLALPGGDRGARDPGLPELPPGPTGRSADRAVLELTSGSSADLSGRPRAALEPGTNGPSALAARLPDAPPELTGPPSPGTYGRGLTALPAGGVAELPGRGPAELLAGGVPVPSGQGTAPSPDLGPGLGPDVGLDLGPGLGLGLSDRTGPGTAVLPAAVLPAAQGAVAQQPRTLSASPAAPRRPSLAESKTRNRRKLATAQELLSRHTSSLGTPLRAIAEALSVQGTWGAGPEQASRPTWTQAAQPVADQAFQPVPEPSVQPAVGQALQSGTEQWAQPGTGQWAQPGTGQWSLPGTEQWSLPGTEQWSLPGMQQPGQLHAQQPVALDFQQPSPLDLQQPDLLGTGQWQQPQWTAPALPQIPSQAAPATAAATVPATAPIAAAAAPAAAPVTAALPATAAAPVTDTGSFASPFTTPLTDTGAFPPVTADPLTDPLTGPLPAVGALPHPASTLQSTRSVRVAKAIAFAQAQIGKPCVWGATGPDSYDCSSLTQGAWRAAGVTLPRAAHEQALAGTPVTLAALEPGDLVLFFGDDRHVGLHIGNAMMIHAPGPGSSIREESIYGAGESAIHRVIRPA